MTRGKIAYVMSRFPHLPETFILREMLEMEKIGWDISIYPLIVQKQNVVHPEARGFLAKVKQLKIFSWGLIRTNLKLMVGKPGLYFSTLFKIIAGNRKSPKFLLRGMVVYPKSVYAADLMKREGIQHIHAHYATHPALAAWIIHRLSGISYSVTVHAHDIYVEKAMLFEKLNEADLIVSISDFNRNLLMREFGEALGEKISVIRCGIFPEYYSNGERNRNKDTKVILNIGSLQPYKGQKYLIDACAILRERGVPFRCKIIGGGELMPALLEQIQQLGLENTVELLGARTQDEIPGLLADGDCYVQPSIITRDGKMEGIPVGIMESMASHLPVVATDISGVPELVIDGDTGLLVEPGDCAALADAIAKILQDEDEAERLAHNGHHWVLQEYNLHQNIQQLAARMETLIK